MCAGEKVVGELSVDIVETEIVTIGGMYTVANEAAEMAPAGTREIIFERPSAHVPVQYSIHFEYLTRAKLIYSH